VPRLPLLLPLAILVAACATGGPAGSGNPVVQEIGGSWVGSLVVERQPFHVTMTLEASGGGRVAGDFEISAPVNADGRVTGVVVDEFVRLTMTYDEPDGCEGRVEGILTVEREGTFFEGPVLVVDCDGEVAGRLSMRRP
jgi:hypothetical protein